jgi:PAS domain S-box-containing protein
LRVTGSSPGFLAGEGEVAALIREMDWTRTPLGSTNSWPQSLRTVMRLALNSEHPMIIWWGPQAIQLHNDAYARMMGPDKHPGALGGSGYDWWPEGWPIIGPQVASIMAGGPSTWHDDQLIPIHRDGADTPSFWTYSLSPIDEAAAPHGIGGVLVMCRDLTEEHRLRQTLAANREDEHRRRLIIESAIDFAIVATDREGMVTDWNTGAERIFGWSAGEMCGTPADRFFTPEDRTIDRLGTEMRRALAQGRASDERWHLRKDNQRFWASGELMPLKGDGGAHLGYIKILRDLTEERRIAEAHRADAEFTRSILSASTDCIKVLDLDGRLTFMSDGGLRLLEVSDFSAIKGSLWPELWDDEGRRAAWAAVNAAKTGETGRFKGFAHTFAGTPKWWDSVVTPIPDAEGRPEKLLSVSRDITEQRWSDLRQTALLELGDRLRDLTTPSDMAFAAAEILGHALQVSRAGYGTACAKHETVAIDRDWRTADRPSIAGNHRFRDFGSYIDALQRGETVICSDIETDPRTIEAVVALRAIGVQAFVNIPIFEHGAFVAIFFVSHSKPHHWAADEVAFLRDVADRTRAAIARQRAESDLYALAASLEQQVVERTADRNRLWELSTDLVLVAQFDGIITAANPAWTTVLGWPTEALLGRSLFDLVLPEDRADIRTKAQRLAEGAKLGRFDTRLRHSDGSYRWIGWSMVQGAGLMNGVGRDFTPEREQAEALQQAEERLRQSQKMEAVGQLTGGLAHDFNNLLTGITGSLELLRTRLAQGRLADVSRYIDAALGAAGRAAALTHRLLAFSRRQTLEPKSIQANALVAGMEELIQRTVGPEIAVETSLHDGLWSILCDPNQLENALLNLCINARDAMPGGGRLTIETANSVLDEAAGRQADMTPGQYVTICVRDTGAGMPPEVVARAFDPFFTTKPLGQGTGLGLSMIYGFAKQSGGQVRIQSEVGDGTLVKISLPRHDGDADAGTVVPEQAASPRARDGEVVLVVDDEPTVRMLVAEVLEELGYAAIEAADGAAGLKVLQSDMRVDLLITDVGLPGGMNGRQLADAARVGRPDLKVLFITGYAETAATDRGGLGSGMQVITKPFAMESLAGRIKTIITG